MPTTPYAGADDFPTEAPLPDDTDPADVYDVAFETVFDRTRFLFNRLVDGCVKSWFALATQTQNLLCAAWSPFDAKWWGGSAATNDKIAWSNDDGATWTAVVPGTSLVKVQSIAADKSGNLVAVGASNTAYEFNGTTWANATIATLASQDQAEVRWESSANLWIAYSTTDAASYTGGELRTSTDRVTWTNQSANLPAIFIAGDAVHVSPSRHVGAANGLLLVLTMLNGVVHTTTAAATAPGSAWTADATITAVMSTPTACSAPVFMPSTGLWYVAISGTNSGVPCTELWQSSNGAAWQRAKTIGGTQRQVAITQLVVLDPIIIGFSSSDGVVYYTDDTAAGTDTWYPARRVGTANATKRAVFAGDGGLLELDTGGTSDGVQASIRTGAPNRVAVGT